MNKEPETYEELIRYKRCVDLTSFYDLTKEDLDKIYNYLVKFPKAIIVGNENSITLQDGFPSSVQPEIINTKCINSGIDGIKLTNDIFTIIPHYVHQTSSGGSSGGFSSNNNNNNNNNNNR